MKDRSKPLLLAVLCMFFGCFGVSAGGMLSTAANGGAGGSSLKDSARSETSVAIATGGSPRGGEGLSDAEILRRKALIEEAKKVARLSDKIKQAVVVAVDAFRATDAAIAETEEVRLKYFDGVDALGKALSGVDRPVDGAALATLQRLRAKAEIECASTNPVVPHEALQLIDTVLSPRATSREMLLQLYVTAKAWLEVYNQYLCITGGKVILTEDPTDNAEVRRKVETLDEIRGLLRVEQKRKLAIGFCLAKELFKHVMLLIRDRRVGIKSGVPVIDADPQFPVLRAFLFDFYTRTVPKICFGSLGDEWYDPQREAPAELFAT